MHTVHGFCRRLLLLTNLAGFGLVVIPSATSVAADARVSLTATEREWLQQHQEWRVVGSYSPPFQWIDDHGVYRGLGADYDALISKKLGTKVRAVPAGTWEKSLEQLQNGECDACSMIIYTSEREKILNFTKEILKLPTVVLVRRDTHGIRSPADLEGKIVAVARSWAIHEELERDRPGIRLDPKDSVELALMDVATGRASAYVGDLASASYGMESLGLANLKVACLMPYSYSLRIGVRKDWPELAPILNQAIDAIGKDEHQVIRNRWLGVHHEGFSFREVLWIVILATVIPGIASLVIYIRGLRREVRLRRAAEQELVETQNATILALSALAETRDRETGEHLHRTQAYVEVLAAELQRRGRIDLTDLQIELLSKCVPLHDIGKVGIPDRILNKPGRLDEAEFAIMKTHAALGAQALEEAAKHSRRGRRFFKLAQEIAMSHHEKWDGSGYPRGLGGESIPLAARLMSVADVYDALRSKRVYKPSMDHAQAVEIIRQGRGRAFDPVVVDAFLALEKEFERIALDGADEPDGECCRVRSRQLVSERQPAHLDTVNARLAPGRHREGEAGGVDQRDGHAHAGAVALVEVEARDRRLHRRRGVEGLEEDDLRHEGARDLNFVRQKFGKIPAFGIHPDAENGRRGFPRNDCIHNPESLEVELALINYSRAEVKRRFVCGAKTVEHLDRLGGDEAELGRR